MSEKEKESLIRTIREIEDLLKNLKREVLKEACSDKSYFYFKETKSAVVGLGAKFEILSDFDFPRAKFEFSDSSSESLK